MKKTSKLLSLMVILSLSACSQAGRITSQSTTSSASQQAVNPVINTLQVNVPTQGINMQVIQNPTPVPGPTVNPNLNQSKVSSKSLFLISKLLSIISSDAQAAYTIYNPSLPTLPDDYELHSSASLLAALNAALGTQFVSLQNQAQLYYASFGSTGSDQAVPAALAVPVTLTLHTYNGKIAVITLPIVEVFAANFGVFTFGTSAFKGIAKLPGASASATAFSLADVSSATVIKVGNTLRIAGGSIGAASNKYVGIVTFGTGTFTVNYAASLAATLPKAKFLPIDSALKTAAGLTNAYIGTKLLIANLNASEKITSFSSLNLNTNVISSETITCANVASYFGYACYTNIGSGTVYDKLAPNTDLLNTTKYNQVK